MSDKEMFDAYQRWISRLPKCLGDFGGCDGDLVGLEHEPHCPMFGKKFTTMRDAFYAGWDAARAVSGQAGTSGGRGE